MPIESCLAHFMRHLVNMMLFSFRNALKTIQLLRQFAVDSAACNAFRVAFNCTIN